MTYKTLRKYYAVQNSGTMHENDDKHFKLNGISFGEERNNTGSIYCTLRKLLELK